MHLVHSVKVCFFCLRFLTFAVFIRTSFPLYYQTFLIARMHLTSLLSWCLLPPVLSNLYRIHLSCCRKTFSCIFLEPFLFFVYRSNCVLLSFPLLFINSVIMLQVVFCSEAQDLSAVSAELHCSSVLSVEF